jgi:outer membrane protein assembly factor BamB
MSQSDIARAKELFGLIADDPDAPQARSGARQRSACGARLLRPRATPHEDDRTSDFACIGAGADAAAGRLCFRSLRELGSAAARRQAHLSSPADELFNADPETAAIVVALPAPVSNADWPQVGGYPDHAMHHLALAAAPTVVWRSSVGTGGDAYHPLVSEPVVAGGRIFALDAASILTAHDLASGDQLWRVNLTPEGDDTLFGGGVATDGARVYATTNYGYVCAVDATSGEVVWLTRIDSPLRAAPALAGDRLIVVTLDNRAIALSANGGEVIWTHSGPVATAGLLGSTSPAIGDGVAIVPYSSGEIFAIDLATGEARWSDAIGRDALRQSPGEVSGITGRITIDRGLYWFP